LNTGLSGMTWTLTGLAATVISSLVFSSYPVARSTTVTSRVTFPCPPASGTPAMNPAGLIWKSASLSMGAVNVANSSQTPT